MSQQEWRTSKFLWLLFGPLLAFTGVLTGLCVVSPLFPDARQQPVVCAFNFFGGVPLFGWMTWSLWRIARINRVRADENGVFISNDGKEARLEWSEIKVLWTQTHSPEGPLYLWARGRDFVIPALERPAELRALLQQRTGLEFQRFIFGPPEEERVISLSGALLCRQWWTVNAIIISILSAVGVPMIWFFFTTSRGWIEPSQLPILSGCALLFALLVLYCVGKAIFDFKRLSVHRSEVWRFDAHSIARDKSGQQIVLPLDRIEKLERIGRHKLRASGAGIELEWPKVMSSLSPEEEFLSNRLKLSWS